MRLPFIISFLLLVLFSFRSTAATSPVLKSTISFPVSITADTVFTSNNNTASNKKPGFFGRLKNKIAGLISANVQGNKSKSSAKKILGWVSLGLIVLSLGIAAAGATGPGIGVLFFAGLATGIVSLCLKKTQEEKEQNKKSNTAAIIGLALGIGLIIIIAIALSGWE